MTIGFYFLHLLIDLAGLVLILWYSGKHRWSKGAFLLLVLPLILVDVLISDWFAGKIRLFEIAHHRHQGNIRRF